MDTHAQFHTDTIMVVGSCLTGRVWRAHSDGTLTGVTYSQIWRTTGNLAHCPYVGMTKGTATADDADPMPGEWQRRHVFYPHGKAKTVPHRPGTPGCSCGFWSYHDLTLSGEWLTGATNSVGVVGLVHAYGVMARGTKGYRSERADIAALIEPGWTTREHVDDMFGALGGDRDRWSAVRETYPTVPVYPSLAEAVAATKSRRVA